MAGRATQIDGLRAFAMLGVACVHWLPREVRGPFPFELGLFYFLVLTGYLITGALLRDRDRGETSGRSWKGAAMKQFQLRRGLRILAPYYAAVIFAILMGAHDIRSSLPWYLLQGSNLHMALTGWPDFTAHFWSLAAQHQFYVLWPFVIWWLPKRWLPGVMIAFVAIAPISRAFSPMLKPWFLMPDLLPTNACDYLGLGGLLALSVHRGMNFDHSGLRCGAWLSFLGYAILYSLHEAGRTVPGLHVIQQTLLSIACCGLIAAASSGFKDWRGRVLDHPAIQHLGRISYSLYLFHNLSPLLAGKILPWLWWNPWFEHGLGFSIRVIVFALLSWLLGWLCWRFIEVPMQGMKARIGNAS